MGDQLKPSKCPLRIRSPIGEGARRGLEPSFIVAERRGLVSREKGIVLGEVLTAVFGGGEGGPLRPSTMGLAKAPLLKESLRSRPEPRSSWGSGTVVGGCWEKRPATAVVARRAWAAAGNSSSS